MPEAKEHTVSRSQLRRRKLRYGFKAEAKRESLRARRAAGVGDHDPIDCFALADQLQIRVVRMSELPVSEHTHHLGQVEPSAMSAATVRRRGRIGIWLNDTHAPERQRSNLAHEIGHVLLDHQDAPPLNDAGCRAYQADMEAEADYFGSVLLVPDVAAVAMVRSGVSVEEAANSFGVSRQLMQWRINDSGAYTRMRRERGTVAP